ncbi:MAG: hypothetical protein MI748_06980, partial [Opitutales bacterium]|nr:hypothetical protein [Opitutales bacterium]
KITIFAAVTMYLLVMISYFKIRKYESDLFLLQKVPYHPYLIGFGIILQIIILITFFYYNYGAALIVFGIELLATLYYLIWGRYKIQEEAPEESKAVYVENKLRIDFH